MKIIHYILQDIILYWCTELAVFNHVWSFLKCYIENADDYHIYMTMEFCTKKINFVTVDQIMYMILMQKRFFCDLIFLSYFRPEGVAYAHVIHKKYYSFNFLYKWI